MLPTQQVQRSLGHATHISLRGQLHQGYVYVGNILIGFLLTENEFSLIFQCWEYSSRRCLLVCRVENDVVLRLFAGTDAVTGLALRQDFLVAVRQAGQSAIVADGQRALARHSHKVTRAVAVQQMQRHGALDNACGVAVELVDSQAILDMLVAVATASLLVAQFLDVLVVEHLDDIQNELFVVAQQDGFAYHALGEVKGHIYGPMHMHLNVGGGMELQVTRTGYAIVLVLHLRHLACLVRVEGEADAVLRGNGQKLLAAFENIVQVAALQDQFVALAAELIEYVNIMRRTLIICVIVIPTTSISMVKLSGHGRILQFSQLMQIP